MAIIHDSEGYAKAVFDINQCTDGRINEYVPVLAGKRTCLSIANKSPFTSTNGKQTPLFTQVGVDGDIHRYSLSEDIFQRIGD